MKKNFAEFDGEEFLGCDKLTHIYCAATEPPVFRRYYEKYKYSLNNLPMDLQIVIPGEGKKYYCNRKIASLDIYEVNNALCSINNNEIQIRDEEGGWDEQTLIVLVVENEDVHRALSSIVVKVVPNNSIVTVVPDVENTAKEIFNLSGLKVGTQKEGLMPGVYIIRDGSGRVRKIKI